jgi:Novel toxin 15
MAGGNYNTTGILKGPSGAAAAKADEASPEIVVTAQSISKLDALQMLLDVVGLIPGFGAPADILNAIISGARGDWLGAGLSLFGVVPVAGEAATAAKIAKNADRYAAAVAKVADEVLPMLPARVQDKLRPAIEAAKKKIDELGGKAPKKEPEPPPKAKKDGDDGQKVKPRETKVPCFHPFDKKKFQSMSPAEQKAYLKEMADQLRKQQDSINGLTAAEFKAARAAFTSGGRNPAADAMQAATRDRVAGDIRASIFGSLKDKLGVAAARREAASRTESILGGLAALHDPDMVAGGWGKPGPTGLGRADVNSSIGGSWNKAERLDAMDRAADDAIREGRGNEKMNVKLEPCRGKDMR